MRKIFSLLAAVLFAGGMMAGTVTFTGADFTGGTADTGSAFSITKNGVTVSADRAYGTGSELRVYAANTNEGLAAGVLTVEATVNITKIHAEFGQNTKMTFEDATPNATSWSVEATKQIRITTLEVTIDGDVAPEMAYYVVGSMTDWQVDAAYKLAVNSAAEGTEYKGTFTFAANTEFKVAYSNGTTVEVYTNWFPTGMDNNYKITEEGNYDVYFRPNADGGDSWHYGCIYAEKKAALADPTNCAEAAEAALSVSANNELYNNGKEYTIQGYVTAIQEEWQQKFKNISFWIADEKDGGKVLEAFRAVCETEDEAPAVGDLVKVTGKLTKYNSTPEFAAGCTFEIIERGEGGGGEGETIIIDVAYAEAGYVPSQGYWQINLYKDYDGTNVTYPDFYIGVAPKSETTIAGTYSLDNDEIYFIEIDLDADTEVSAEEASDFVVTYLGEGVYHYELEFLGEDGNTYILDVEAETIAYNAETEEDIELTDGEQAIDNTEVKTKAIKAIVNGVLIIEKNNVRYNMNGNRVR